jgi:ribosomal protein L16 Arg81 hydroxylase
MDFAQFIAPMPVAEFLGEYVGRRPVHIKAPEGDRPARASLLTLDRLGELMGVLDHWTEDNLKLIINSRPILGDHYLAEPKPGGSGARRADPAKVHVFLRIGASLVANSLEDVDPAIRQVAAMLGDQFAATSGANAYCSFKDVQAFNSHCDLHEVFAVHLEGEKTWGIYENRADAPVEPLEGEGAQAIIDRAKGEVMMTAHMRPGDLLYIPRGYFHDALASSDASLHLTFAVAPLYGRYIFRLLDELTTRDPGFRAYISDGRQDEGAALQADLDGLAGRVAELIRSPLFADELTARQRALAPRDFAFDFRERPKVDYYARTERPAEVDWRLSGAVLRHGHSEDALGALARPAEWALEQAAFSEQQLHARFGWLDETEVRKLVQLLTRSQLFVPYDPPL